MRKNSSFDTSNILEGMTVYPVNIDIVVDISYYTSFWASRTAVKKSETSRFRHNGRKIRLFQKKMSYFYSSIPYFML